MRYLLLFLIIKIIILLISALEILGMGFRERERERETYSDAVTTPPIIRITVNTVTALNCFPELKHNIL